MSAMPIPAREFDLFCPRCRAESMAAGLSIAVASPMHRSRDPATSRAAAARVNVSAGRHVALHWLARGPATDFELATFSGLQQTSIGKRRLECQRAGWVEEHVLEGGKTLTRPAPSGAAAIVWRLTDAGRIALRAAVEL